MSDSTIERRYAGKKSQAFWDRVNAIKDETLHSIAYNAGVMLQSIEEMSLKMIEQSEKADSRKAKKKRRAA